MVENLVLLLVVQKVDQLVALWVDLKDNHSAGMLVVLLVVLMVAQLAVQKADQMVVLMVYLTVEKRAVH
jgi:hypothetical protein